MSTPQNVRLPGITCGRLQITAVRYGDGAMLITRQTAPEWMIGAATGPWHRKADGRFEAERTVICASRVQFVKRLSGFPGLWDWLLAAEFTALKMRRSSTRAAMGRAGRSAGMFLARCRADRRKQVVRVLAVP